MQPSNSKSRFVLAKGQQQPLSATAAQPTGSGLVFHVGRGQPAFAWLGSGRLSRSSLPFAKVGSGVWEPPASADALLRRLLSEEPDEPQGPRRGHTDEWYQQRMVFCATCKGTINSHYQKQGSRCQGCRRWFHAACMPAAATGAPAAEEAAAAQDAAAGAANPGSNGQSRRQRGVFLHDDDCREVYDRLAAVAAAGQQPFTIPDARPFWQTLFGSQPPHQEHTWRLLDLSQVRHAYKDAQKRETLFRAHRKAQRQLDAAAEAAAERAEAARRSKGFFGFGSSSSSSGGGGSSGGQKDQGLDAARGEGVRWGVKASLDDMMVVSEVLKPLGETPRDLLEDSYALITRDDSDGPAAVATFNVYGSDHARLQGVATPAYLQRQGHATRLLQQLEVLLSGAGVQELVVILEPQDDKQTKPNPQVLAPEAAEHWFRRRLGFKSASSEQRMLWRRELPEYHKGLVGGCSLLVKPLPKAKAKVATRKGATGSKKAA